MSDEHDPFIERVAEALRAPVRVDPAFDAQVLAEVQHRRGRLGRVAHALRWLVEPRPIAVSPLGATALAAGLVVAAVAIARAGLSERGAPAPLAGIARDSGQVFVFIAPAARSVAVAGDFNDWNPAATPMHRVSEGGAWLVTVPLRPGRYMYSFVVDGREWRPDPLAPPAPHDDFGKPNSVVLVRSPTT